MATVISIAERRGAKASENRQSGHSLTPGMTVVMFTAVALAMTAAAVLVGANSWDDAITLVILISVVALLKLALADAMFIAMLRADEQTDRRIVQEPEPEPPKHNAQRPDVVRHLAVRARRMNRAAPSFELVARGSPAIHPLDLPDRKQQR
jgi:hypothetical protein